MSIFQKMKTYLKTDRTCDLCIYSPFSDYIDEVYSTAQERLLEVYEDLYIEPSTQGGAGIVFASYTVDGTVHRTNWDFQQECETIEKCACETNTEEEFIQSIVDFLNSRLEDAEEVCDDESEDN